MAPFQSPASVPSSSSAASTTAKTDSDAPPPRRSDRVAVPRSVIALVVFGFLMMLSNKSMVQRVPTVSSEIAPCAKVNSSSSAVVDDASSDATGSVIEQTTTTTTTLPDAQQPQMNRNRMQPNPSINVTDYQWFGNTWIPPAGIPHYALQEIREAFSKHHVLFLGDSTIRRLYGTLYQLLNASSTAINKTELDHSSYIDINKNRRGKQEICRNRGFVDMTRARFRSSSIGGQQDAIPVIQQMWDHPNDTRAFHCHDIVTDDVSGNSNNINHNHTITTQFDYGRMNCYNEITKLVNLDFMNQREISKNYTLVVFGLGLWDAVKPYDCRKSANDNNPTSRLRQAFEWATSFAGPDSTMLWRTIGYQKDGIGTELIQHLNGQTMEVLKGSQMRRARRSAVPLNASIVDWATAIYPRSFGDQRIDGDIHAHYGLEARLLLIQMLVHEIKQ
eukprot:CAMPEP_0119557694 /NCGR_PEP_ID=MMETSP1352-20130426/9279_1 /TAXON_ID=265584 /ORGANISM="Stauroneis constricta, Strain CCMP1120" /LENGTH=445 /DNA_ID=CAMNT_0007604833 /DNA_START=51 /DNA_END=1385 /DNA_ORIENTATION=+